MTDLQVNTAMLPLFCEMADTTANDQRLYEYPSIMREYLSPGQIPDMGSSFAFNKNLLSTLNCYYYCSIIKIAEGSLPSRLIQCESWKLNMIEKSLPFSFGIVFMGLQKFCSLSTQFRVIYRIFFSLGDCNNSCSVPIHIWDMKLLDACFYSGKFQKYQIVSMTCNRLFFHPC